MKAVAAGFCGFIFALGLMVSGMADPANVLGFLDVTGAWNPLLAFVMGGAVAVTLPGFGGFVTGRLQASRLIRRNTGRSAGRRMWLL